MFVLCRYSFLKVAPCSLCDRGSRLSERIEACRLWPLEIMRAPPPAAQGGKASNQSENSPNIPLSLLCSLSTLMVDSPLYYFPPTAVNGWNSALLSVCSGVWAGAADLVPRRGLRGHGAPAVPGGHSDPRGLQGSPLLWVRPAGQGQRQRGTTCNKNTLTWGCAFTVGWHTFYASPL